MLGMILHSEMGQGMIVCMLHVQLQPDYILGKQTILLLTYFLWGNVAVL
jgi:hypothetical protein